MSLDLRPCRYCGATIVPSRIGPWWRRLNILPGYGITQCPARQANAGVQPNHEPAPSPTPGDQT